MRFTLSIEIGNDAMQNAEHVSGALLHLSDAIVDYDLTDAKSGPGMIRDDNGNVVGRWEVIEDEPTAAELQQFAQRLEQAIGYDQAERDVARAERSTRRAAGYRD